MYQHQNALKCCLNIKCKKPLYNNSITSDKTNFKIQVDANYVLDNHHFWQKKLSYAKVLRAGKDINNTSIELQ